MSVQSKVGGIIRKNGWRGTEYLNLYIKGKSSGGGCERPLVRIISKGGGVKKQELTNSWEILGGKVSDKPYANLSPFLLEREANLNNQGRNGI